MYDADPFSARREVEERQARAAKKREEATAGGSGISRPQFVSNEFTHAPEVKMASRLREIVEDAVKKVSTSLLAYSIGADV